MIAEAVAEQHENITGWTTLGVIGAFLVIAGIVKLGCYLDSKIAADVRAKNEQRISAGTAAAKSERAAAPEGVGPSTEPSAARRTPHASLAADTWGKAVSAHAGGTSIEGRELAAHRYIHLHPVFGDGIVRVDR